MSIFVIKNAAGQFLDLTRGDEPLWHPLFQDASWYDGGASIVEFFEKDGVGWSHEPAAEDKGAFGRIARALERIADRLDAVVSAEGDRIDVRVSGSVETIDSDEAGRRRNR